MTEELVTIDENLRYDFDYQVKYINTICHSYVTFLVYTQKITHYQGQ